MNKRSLLRPFLVLVAVHSFIVGVLLLFLPAEMMSRFGYGTIQEAFFMRQGGIFHLVMSVAYVMAVYYYQKQNSLIFFSIFAKSLATVFLFSYYLFISHIWMVMLSGVGDAIMAILLYYLFNLENNGDGFHSGKTKK